MAVSTKKKLATHEIRHTLVDRNKYTGAMLRELRRKRGVGNVRKLHARQSSFVMLDHQSKSRTSVPIVAKPTSKPFTFKRFKEHIKEKLNRFY